MKVRVKIGENEEMVNWPQGVLQMSPEEVLSKPPFTWEILDQDGKIQDTVEGKVLVQGNRILLWLEDGQTHEFLMGKTSVNWKGHQYTMEFPEKQWQGASGICGDARDVTSKMPGKILKVLVKNGDVVKKGDPLLVMEAMKMENEIKAHAAGTVCSVNVKVDDTIETGAKLVTLDLDS